MSGSAVKDANDPQRLQRLRTLLQEQKRYDETGDEAKQWLRVRIPSKRARRVCLACPHGRWVAMSSGGWMHCPMLRSYLEGDSWFDTHWPAVAHVESGLS